MALPVWPASLPQEPLLDGYEVGEPFMPPIATEMEDGATRMRKRATFARSRIRVRYLFRTEAEAAAFKAFVTGTLSDGSLPFMIPVHVFEQGFVSKRATIDKGTYSLARHGLAWVATFTLIVRDW